MFAQRRPQRSRRLDHGLRVDVDRQAHLFGHPVHRLLPLPSRIYYILAMIGWSRCPDVERIPGKASGRRLMRGTRIPVDDVLPILVAQARPGQRTGVPPKRPFPALALTT
jgi:hypothetical protein